MQNHDLAFGWRGLDLRGTLHLPGSGAGHPTVVMIQGSGPSDRDSNGYFPEIRDAFLSRGIATYAFDKPGCGESTGDWRQYALEERAAQAMGAIDTVRDHPATDDGIIGIWGQSQGGWIVQMLASRLPDLAFAIANSGPSIGVADQDLYGCEHSMRTDGRSEDEIAHALDFIGRVHRAAAIGADFATVEVELIAPARSQSWYRYLTIDDETGWDLVGSFITESYDPLATLRLIHCPFLAIYGGGDVLLPAWRSAEESGRELRASGNPDATIVVFPQGDHRIRAATTGEFVAGYLDLLGDWAAHRIRRARSRRSTHAASS